MYYLITLPLISITVYYIYRFLKTPTITINYKQNNLPIQKDYYKGWYCLGNSNQLKVKEIKQFKLFDQEIVLYRGVNNVIYALESRCKHLGANLINGCVIDNKIQCGFHGWKYNGDGTLITKEVTIEYEPNNDIYIEKVCKLQNYLTIEINNLIYLWFGLDTPDWYPPEIKQLEQWSYRGSSDINVNASLIDIVNNGVDVVHFKYVHTDVLPLNKYFPFHWRIFWKILWKPKCDLKLEDVNENLQHYIKNFDSIPDQYISTLLIYNKLNFLGWSLPMDMFIFQVGPGLTYLFFNSFLGTGMYLQQFNPIDNYCKIRNYIYTQPSTSVFSSFILLLVDVIQLSRDAKIWNNKQPSSINTKLFLKKNKLDLDNILWWKWFRQFYFKMPTLDF